MRIMPAESSGYKRATALELARLLVTKSAHAKIDAGHTKVDHAVGYPQFYSRSHHAVIRVFDDAGN
jgi:hypothetical protein